ncbi:MAG: hypothetical protein ACFFCS_07535 [Candidatus Hodarchaeota archaeon]
MRKMRLVGLVIFFGNTFLLFTFSLFHSFNLFSLLNISGVKYLFFPISKNILKYVEKNKYS